MENADIFQTCFDNICKNYNLPASLRISEPMQDRIQRDCLTIFIDLHMAGHISFIEQEILKNILETGIKSKKDYRGLRSLIRLRLISVIRDLRDLTEDSLRNLGAKV